MAKFKLSSIVPADEFAAMDAAYKAALDDYANDVLDALNDNLIDLFSYLVGENPKQIKRGEVRWRGVSGNQVVSVVTRRTHNFGSWYDHAAGVGGGPIQAIQHFLGIGHYRAALDEAAARYGLPIFDPKAVRQEISEKLAKERAEKERLRAEKLAEALRLATKEDADDIAKNKKVWDASTDVVAGSPGDIYLRNVRGIRPDGGWPSSVRWCAAEHALIFAVTNAQGDFVGFQIVAVTKDGRQDKKRYGEKVGAKLSKGKIGLGSVKFPGDPSGPIACCEGPETGLSVWLATGYETRVMLGSSGFKRIINEAPRDRKLILCRDDDPTMHPAYRSAVDGLYMLANAGFDVWDAWPFEERRQQQEDFNDLLLSDGPAAVKARIDQALTEPLKISRIEHDLDKAKGVIKSRITGFYKDAAKHQSDDRQLAILQTVDTGGGKTHEAIEAGVADLQRRRSKDDMRAGVLAAPEHKLTKEIERRVNDEIQRVGADLVVARWLGREALRPDAQHDDDKMCAKIEDVRLAEEMLVDVEEEICKVCPHALDNGGACPYQTQRTIDADIWIVAHQVLFRKAPAPIKKRGVAWTIIDENMIGAGIRAPTTIPIDAFEPYAMALPRDEEKRLDLIDARHRLSHILGNAPDGYLHKSALREKDYAISYEMAEHAARLEWDRKLDKRHQKDWHKRDANRTIKKAAANWKAIANLAMILGGPERSGFIKVDRDRELARVVRVSSRAQIHEDWRAPTLVLDATCYNVEPLKKFLPTIEELPRVDIASPHQKIIQVINKSYSLAWLAPPKKRKKKGDQEAAEPVDGEEASILLQNLQKRAQTAADNRREVAASILRIHRQNGGKTMIVGNKDVVNSPEFRALTKIFPKDRGISTWWYGAVAGRDGAGDVRTLIVLGRPLPAPGAIETMAATLTGEAVETIAAAGSRRSGWYQRERGYRLRRQGGAIVRVPCEVDCHPDPMAEALRQEQCVGAVMQAIGRGRGVRRKATPDGGVYNGPLDVVVMTDVVLPVPVDQFILAQDLAPSIEDLQLLAGGVAFDGGASAAAAYPDLWPTDNAFAKAVARENERDEASRAVFAVLAHRVTKPNNRYYKDPSPCEAKPQKLAVEFQRAGDRRRPERAVYDPAICPDPIAFIESRVGPLAWFNVERPEIPAPEVETLPIAVGAEDLVAPMQWSNVRRTDAPAIALTEDPPEDPPDNPSPAPIGDTSPQKPSQPVVADRPPILARLVEMATAQSFAGAIVLGVPMMMGAVEAPDRVAAVLAIGQDIEEEEDGPRLTPDWPAIRELLRDAGLPHSYLADKCNISQSHLSNMERGFRKVTPEVAAVLEQFLREMQPTQPRLF